MSLRDLPAVAVPTKPAVRTEVTEKAVNRWNPDVRAASTGGDERTLSILEPIGEDWFGDGVSSKRIAAALRHLGPGPVTANVNSPGGDFFEGLTIYNLLREHDGEVTIKILGMAASAASIIAMAGDTIQMARASFMMIHNTWVLAAGDRHAFRDVADWLEPFDQAAVSIYGARTGIGEKELGKMLDKETWIGGDAAIDKGFADSLLASDEIAAEAQNATELSPKAAQKKLDLVLATGNRIPKSERRNLLAALKGGKSGAAPTGTSGAAVSDLAQKALDKINSM
ncbi:head maturation protease, ClpP-related [Shimia sagamensis]|uniref:ATP-dependent Clp protease proteolytic subunit n=1 Tax=Shimia sagamensis TaxID=1566352 RepID=A0ABY1PEM8_9RHOB|nr:head maturation protease, ClpP-related [Shimia sagamensis]SMP32145.1 ATP-dependent protease ClpP, protease subunit [Shimia sagamensis]